MKEGEWKRNCSLKKISMKIIEKIVGRQIFWRGEKSAVY
jgi:hypothetical protein